MNQELKKASRSNFLVITGVTLALAIVAIVGATYAYFTVTAPATHIEVKGTATTYGSLTVTGAAVNFGTAAKPGATANSTITITNGGSTAVTYGLNYVVTSNGFDSTLAANAGDILVQVTKGTNGCTVNTAMANKYVPKLTTSTSYEVVPMTCSIAGNTSHTYNATATFVETNVNQNTNQGKSLASYFEVVTPTQQ